MSNRASIPIASHVPDEATSSEAWHTFDDILRRLHRERVYIHPQQLAEFFVAHGLPVDLRYVPPHLKQKAEQINVHYQGDLARLEDGSNDSFLFAFE